MYSKLSTYMSPELKEFAKQCLSWVPPSWRYGKTYRKWCRFLISAQHWPHDRIQEWQLEQAKAIITHAYENTSGYRELFRAHGVQPEDITSLDDMKLLPFTTKELIRDNLKDFSVRSLTGIYRTTGGSKGTPLGFYEPWYISEIEDAFMFVAWSSVGWQLGEMNAVLRGGFVGTESEPWRYDQYRNELKLSSYNLTERTIDTYIDVIRRYRPRVLQAYPSSVETLCDLLQDSDHVGDISFDLILLGSENVYGWILRKIDQVFPEARPFAWYGHSEKAIFAPWCEFEKKYHVSPFYGYTELLDHNDEDAEQGVEGELIGTGFHMKITPFIRYRTMDKAIRVSDSCDSCGRPFTILGQVVGRSHEVILTGNGRRVPMTAMCAQTVDTRGPVFDNMRQFQFYQDEVGKVILKVVRKDSYTDDYHRRLTEELAKKLGEDTELEIVFVDHIPRTRSGKLTVLDQRLRIGEVEVSQ